MHPCHYTWIEQHMLKQLKAKPPKPVSIRTMCCDFTSFYGLKISRCVMTTIMRNKLGATFGKHVVKKDNFNRHSHEATRLRHEFLHRSSRMLALEEAGEAVNVFFDESYVHTSHVASRSWHLPNHAYTAPTKGRRMIILHALTKHGWVVTLDENGDPIQLDKRQDSDLKHEYLTAEMIFPAKSSKGDYHDNMDSPTYLAWLTNRCHPTLRKLFPGKRFFYWLDNARYHKSKRGHPSVHKGDKWQGISTLNKSQCVNLLKLWNVTSFTCTRANPNPDPADPSGGRTTHTFSPDTDGKVKYPRGPNVLELRQACLDHQDEHPEFFETLADEALKQLSLADSEGSDPLFHRFNYTPPNEGFAVQATEEAWGIIKGYVAMSPEDKKKNTDLIRLVREGMYGIDKEVTVGSSRGKDKPWTRSVLHPPVPCDKLVRRCLDRAGEWVKEFNSSLSFPCCTGTTISDYECTANKVDAKVSSNAQQSWLLNLESESDDDDVDDNSDHDDEPVEGKDLERPPTS